MRGQRLNSLLRITLLASLLGVSCGGSDNGNGPGNGGEPPAIPEFSNPTTVGIVPINSDAQAARTLAQQYLESGVNAFDPLVLSPNRITDWGAKSGDCWTKPTVLTGCTTTWDVCDTTSGYKWTGTLDGTCGGQKPFGDWVGAHGATSTDGRVGNMEFYADSGTAVANTMTWSVAANDKSGNVQLYSGDDELANLNSNLAWTINANQSKDYTGEDYSFGGLAASVTERVKWELHLSPDSDSGWMKTYTWSGTPASYRMRNRIAWDPDSAGSWIEYDANNQILHQRLWHKNTFQPPRLRAPHIHDTVDFCSDDPEAQQAEMMVHGMLSTAGALSGLGAAYFAALDSAQWGNVISGCRSWSYAYSGCSWQYRVCEQGSNYQWTYSINGSCFGYTYSNWTAFQGTTSSDGGSGTLISYQTNSTLVQATWKWNEAPDGKSGWWEFYDGPESPTTLQVRFTWADNVDGSSDVVWESFDSGTPQSKWEIHVSADGKSGWLKFYEYNDTTSAYWRQQEILWNSDCSGSSTYYDEQGNILTQQTW